MANGLRAITASSIRVEDNSGRQESEVEENGAEREEQEVERALNDPASGSSRIIKTKTTTTTTTTTEKTHSNVEENLFGPNENDGRKNVAVVEHMGKRAAPLSELSNDWTREKVNESEVEKEVEVEVDVGAEVDRDEFEGNKLVTTVSTIGAQCGQSRLVLALLKEGDKFQMKVQEMRPPIFEVGFNRNECIKYFDEHQRMLANMRRQEKAPIELWLQKYQKIRASESRMSTERQLIYMCMLENLQACWKASLKQLDKRAQLLELACNFYELAERVARSIELAENHVQTFRLEFLNGPNSKRFNEARNELRALNKSVIDSFELAKRKQQQLIELIRNIANGNLGDARVNHLISDAQNLINYIGSYLEPFQKRRIQLESVLKTTTTTTTTINNRTITSANQFNRSINQSSIHSDGLNKTLTNNKMNSIREISNFNDLHFVDNWLSLKIEQLNSSLLSSLGVGDLDSRTILSKHEQILLECRTIEEATLMFKGKNIHAIKSIGIQDDTKRNKHEESLFEQQRLLSSKARDVITILEARIALLRRTIDFHVRSKEATSDIGKMMRRLQVDNSLQSVEFVANELELKDVSSVVASGATIISELQQLQLAQQHGQRSDLVNLNLVTSGIRTAIDLLNQELAHLKTVLNQRKLVLLNEDVNKMANNFNQKCNQLHFWLQNHVRTYLINNNRIGLDLNGARQFCQNHQQIRHEVQKKTLEVEALLRSLSSLTDENFDTKSKLGEKIQRSMDELRQDWILVTNCLERRMELAKKYLTLMATISMLDKELDSLESFQMSHTGELPERSDEEIQSNIEQLSQQLCKQLQLLRLEAQKVGTELKSIRQEEQNEQSNAEQSNELNKNQMLEHADNLFGQLAARKRSLYDGRNLNRPTEKASSGSIIQQQSINVTREERANKLETPKFKQTLCDKWALPFSPIELECELEGDHKYELEWLMNNFRKIPASIRHSTSKDGNKHKLTIHNFGPQCCGTFLARAWNSSGQVVSKCELRLAGINRQKTEQQSTIKNDSALLAHRWPPINKRDLARDKQPSAQKKAMARIVQGVESLSQTSDQQTTNIATTATTTATTTTTTSINNSRFEQGDWKLPMTESKYSGIEPINRQSHQQQQLHIGSSNSNESKSNKQLNRFTSDTTFGSPSSSATLSRSISRSPFDGTPQPPKFVQPICRSASSCYSRAGLLCVVVANPPPTIEWIHNNQTIAVAKCPPINQRSTRNIDNSNSNNKNNDRGNICKLTIETVNDLTSGEYTCRASNRIGQSSCNFTLTN